MAAQESTDALRQRVLALEAAASSRAAATAVQQEVLTRQARAAGQGDVDSLDGESEAAGQVDEDVEVSTIASGKQKTGLLERAVDKVKHLRSRCADLESQVAILTHQLDLAEEQRLRTAKHAHNTKSSLENTIEIPDKPTDVTGTKAPPEQLQQLTQAHDSGSSEGVENSASGLLSSLTDAQLFYHGQLHATIAKLHSEKVFLRMHLCRQF